MGQIDGDIAGLRKKRSQFNPALANKGVGKWEQHTKGIGAKLLLQVRFHFTTFLNLTEGVWIWNNVRM